MVAISNSVHIQILLLKYAAHMLPCSAQANSAQFQVVLLDEDITNEKLTLQWSFGRSLTVDVAYRMEVFRDPETAAELFEFLWDKQKCFGRYHPASKSAVFNLNLRDGLVVIIYRIVSNNVLAVTITDTRSLDGNIPTVQVGLMNRIQKELYE